MATPKCCFHEYQIALSPQQYLATLGPNERKLFSHHTTSADLLDITLLLCDIFFTFLSAVQGFRSLASFGQRVAY